MQKEFVDTLSKANKQAFDAAKEIAELNASTFGTVLDKQLEIANQLAEVNVKQTQIVAEYKDAPSAFQAQSALVRELTEQAAGNARDMVEILNKTRTAYDKLFQKGVKDAADAVEKMQSSHSAAA